jgi:hypothetical protein
MVNCDGVTGVAVVERFDFAALDVGRGDNEFDFGSRDPPNIDVLGESSLYRAQIVKARPQWQIVVVLPWQIEIRIAKIGKKPFDLRRQQVGMKDGQILPERLEMADRIIRVASDDRRRKRAD